jgi:uncharacterized protein (TIGR00369 family)
MTNPASDADQADVMAALRRHYEEGIAFNVLCGFRVTRLTADGVTIEVSYDRRLDNGLGAMHGGTVSTLVDTAASAAASAALGHAPGTWIATVDMALQYLAPITDVGSAHATCTKHGRRLVFVDVVVRDGEGEVVARGLVTVRVSE